MELVSRREFLGWEENQQVQYLRELFGESSFQYNSKKKIGTLYGKLCNSQNGYFFVEAYSFEYGDVILFEEEENGSNRKFYEIYVTNDNYANTDYATMKGHIYKVRFKILKGMNQERLNHGDIPMKGSRAMPLIDIPELVDCTLDEMPIIYEKDRPKTTASEYVETIIKTAYKNLQEDYNERLKANMKEAVNKLRETQEEVANEEKKIADLQKEIVGKEEELKKIYAEKEEELKEELKLAQKETENALKKQTDELTEKIVETEKTLQEVKNQYEEYRNLINTYKLPIKLPAMGEVDTLEKTGETDIKMNSQDLSNYVWKYLWEKKGLQYDPSVISRFLASLHTDQITILWGEPGSGKTSLPIAVAEAIGAKCEIIPVQPSWGDNMDLLGYYDVRNDRFVPTKFTECLAEARKVENRNTLYFILLDEMNLARIEYYFSEVLSAITMPVGKRNLNLYSSAFAVALEDNWKELKEKNGEAVDKKQCARITDALCYPSQMEIPSNVRFIGTLNMDQTTKDLSPKVVDRSYALHIENLSSKVKASLADEIKELSLSDDFDIEQKISASAFEPTCPDEKDDNAKKELKKIDSLKDVFAELCILSNRFDVYVKQLLGWDKELTSAEAINEWVDNLIYDKILVSVHLEEKNVESAKKALEHKDFLKLYKKSRAKLEAMISDAEENEESHYWS